jgi:hypothetical protein
MGKPACNVGGKTVLKRCRFWYVLSSGLYEPSRGRQGWFKIKQFNKRDFFLAPDRAILPS